MSKVLKLRIWPDPVLETKAEPVTEFNQSLKDLAENMRATMLHDRGVGLAANQVGELRRILVIHIPYLEDDEQDGLEKRWWHDQVFFMVNPVINEKSSRKVSAVEGCLSFPDIYEYVPRYETIQGTYFDVEGNQHSFEADGLFSVAVQHEIDHLDGVVFFKRMSRLKASTIRKKLLRRKQLS